MLATLAVVASLVVVSAGAAHAVDPTVTRVGGADRYETAALISKGTFGPGVDAAFIATGEDFPDALAAAGVAGHTSSPILLVRRDSIPQTTQDELTRLQPKQIVVVGGEGVVSQNVFNQLDAFTDGFLQRIQGPDRYATAAALSKAVYPSTAQLAFIATGRNFPDALAAGPAAAQESGPILLVPGQGPLPASVKNEIGRLKPTQLVVLGGLGAIDHNELEQLDALLPSGGDLFIGAGANRFTTAVTVSQSEFAQASQVVLTTGLNYPDALSAGSPAGIAHAPILLVNPTCIPPQVNAEIVRLHASQIIVVGGTGAVGPGVLSRTICTGDQPGHFSFADNDVLVGAQGVPAGTYRTRTASTGCVWARFSGPDLQNDLITATGNDGPEIMTIKPSDYLFTSDGCATWTNDLSAITSSPTAPLPPGNYFVGTDVAPGTWTAPGSDDCFWQRESGFGAEDADILDDNGGQGDATHNVSVTIAPTDAGFYSEGCGTWTKTG
jgi:putative cell wall-binding protein